MGKRKLLSQLSARQMRRKATLIDPVHEPLMQSSCLNTDARESEESDLEDTLTSHDQFQNDDLDDETVQHTIIDDDLNDETVQHTVIEECLPGEEHTDPYCTDRDDLDIDRFYLSEEDVEFVSESDDPERTETVQETSKTSYFLNSLRDWIFRFKIPLNAVTALLCILSLLQPSLPKDARTFLKTPRSTTVSDVAPGKYWHRGLKKGLRHFLGETNVVSLELSFNVDGFPIAESSSSVLWPILCSVNNMGVFIVGIYHGYEKPSDANIFLQKVVDELHDLTTKGIEHNGKTIPVIFKSLICDAPAKAFVLGTTSHNSRHGCSKCTVEGEYLSNRMSYPNLDAPLRTNESFRSKSDEDYHKSDSILLSLPCFLPVTNVVLDYMHLICEGVVKKLLLAWLAGPLAVRLCAQNIAQINESLDGLSSFIPKEFARKPRSLRFVRKWKATEFRLFLLYIGVVVLRGKISKALYDNFVTLHVAIRMLCDRITCQNYELINYANGLLRHFVRTFMNLYGRCFVSHNVHGLIHIAEDAKNHGHLDEFSSFPYESFLFQIGTLLKKADKPLQQIMRRYTEREDNFYFTQKTTPPADIAPKLSGNHLAIEKLPSYCVGPQYLYAKFQSFVLRVDNKADRCCSLEDESIVLVESFAHMRDTGEPALVGRKLPKKKSLYDKPCNSRRLGIFIVQGSSELCAWPLKQVKHKCMRLPTGKKHEFAIFPVIHTTS